MADEAAATPDEQQPEQEAPDYVSREDYEQLIGNFNQLVEYVQSQASPAQPGQVDFLAEDAQHQLDRYIEQKLQPLLATQESTLMAQGEQQFRDTLESIQAEKGELLIPDLADEVFARSQRLYSEQFANKYGETNQAAELAIEAAYEEVKAIEQKIVEAGMARENNHLKTLAGARSNPSASGRDAMQQITVEPGGDEFSILKKYFPTATERG